MTALLYVIFDSTHIAKWDINETKAGGPFEEILQYDIFVNNIKLTKVRFQSLDTGEKKFTDLWSGIAINGRKGGVGG